MICIFETWLKENETDSPLNLNSFHLFQLDQDTSQRKELGGGVFICINHLWCHKNNVTMINKSCFPDLEFLALKSRLYYLPWEFPSIEVNTAYISPDANYDVFSETCWQSECGDLFNLLKCTWFFCIYTAFISTFPGASYLLLAAPVMLCPYFLKYIATSW